MKFTEQSWLKPLKDEFKKTYFRKLLLFVNNEYKDHTIYPTPNNIFQAFDLCPFEKTRIVILGQDPYHRKDQAHGLSFSVPENVKIPPSLRNIYKELQSDLRGKPRVNGNLENWAKQGVLLLNATLTVRAGSAGSHQHKGWEIFTDAVIQTLSDNKEHLVFLLWGKYAQKKGSIIDASKHLVLTAAHPSPFSAHTGFFGCQHFSKTNTYLVEHNQKPIKWI